MPGGLWKNRAPLSIENFSKDAGNQSSQLEVEFQNIFSAARFQLGSSEGGNFDTIINNKGFNPTSINSDYCALFDTIHDFGRFKDSDDVLLKSRGDTTNAYLNSLVFFTLGYYGYGLETGNMNFYKNFGKLNGMAFNLFSLASSITNDETEQMILLSALMQAGDAENLSYYHTTSKKMKEDTTKKEVYDIILAMYNDYLYNSKDGSVSALPVVIDTNKSLFTSKDKNLDDRFIYLLTQEGINDPSSKKNPYDNPKPFTNKTFFVESPGQNRTYKAKTDIPGLFDVEFNGMPSRDDQERFKKGINTNIIYKDADKIINYNYNIPFNDKKKNPNVIETLSKFFQRHIKARRNSFNQIRSDSIINHELNNVANLQNVYDIIAENQDGIQTKIQNIKIEINLLFSQKRYGDQLQAKVVDFIRHNVNGIDFIGLDNAPHNVKNAVLVTGDRMLFAFAILNKIPCILDYGSNLKTIIVYKPPAVGGLVGGAAAAPANGIRYRGSDRRSVEQIDEDESKFNFIHCDEIEASKLIDTDGDTLAPYIFVEMYYSSYIVTSFRKSEMFNQFIKLILAVPKRTYIDKFYNSWFSNTDNQDYEYKIHLVKNEANEYFFNIFETEYNRHKSVNEVKIKDISIDIHGYVYINKKKDNPLSTDINIGTSIISFINLFKSEEYNYANELNELNHSEQQNIGKQVLMSKRNKPSRMCEGCVISGGGDKDKSINGLMDIIMNYQIKTIHDYDERSQQNTSYYINSQAEPFFIPEELELNIFLQLLISNLDKKIDINQIEDILHYLEDMPEAKNLLDIIEHIREYLEIPFVSQKLKTFDKNTIDLVKKCLTQLYSKYDSVYAIIDSKNYYELLDYALTENLIDLSYMYLCKTLYNDNENIKSKYLNVASKIASPITTTNAQIRARSNDTTPKPAKKATLVAETPISLIRPRSSNTASLSKKSKLSELSKMLEFSKQLKSEIIPQIPTSTYQLPTALIASGRKTKKNKNKNKKKMSQKEYLRSRQKYSKKKSI